MSKEIVDMVYGWPLRHRGVMLDSARNFINLKVIQRVIDGMSFSKVKQSTYKLFKVL